MSIPEASLFAVSDRASLLAFLRDQLDWPVDPEDTFTYQGPQLHAEISARAEVSQIVPFTMGDPFTIMLVEFQTPFRRGDLRTILQKMREDMRKRAKYGGRKLDEIVFVCATENYAGLRFVRFEEQTGRQPKMSLFGWDRDHPGGTRTLQEFNLPALTMPEANLLGEPDWTQARWHEAWDVEKVTREFFREYRQTFETVEQQIAAANPAQSRDWRLFTQRLFNRLMFIQFLSKRGWLRYEGSTDYLPTLFTRSSGNGENFYRDRLYWVCFYGLGSGEVGPAVHAIAALKDRRGEVPYLNGGLFEMVNDGATPAESSDAQGAVAIPNAAFERILFDLFARWNFTITESTPLDVEVAVDPEMLGKVFEELVTGRHESGSYYTPRGIVAFMCREALKHYLQAAGIGGEAVAKFVDERSAADFGDQDFETALSALQRVRVVDPACGSGAYLLGMLHELVELRKLLFNPNRKDDAQDDYNLKLDIIRRNLYGVDLDEFAVNIARLRLWLSLAVEHEGETPEPLPNLDFKIERGDSLIAPSPQGGTQTDIRASLVDDFARSKYDHADPYYQGDKAALKSKIGELRQDIAFWTHSGTNVPGFDWRVEFAEVFDNLYLEANSQGNVRSKRVNGQQSGFDIVIANPPYLSTKHGFGQENRALLMKNYQTAKGQFDAYALFLERALALLSDQGCYAYIIPKPVLTNSNMLPVRSLLQISKITAIADPGTVFVASVEPIILVGCKQSNASGTIRIFSEGYFRNTQRVPYSAKAEDVCTPAGTWNIATSAASSKSIARMADLPHFGDLFEIKRGVECGKRDSAIHRSPQPGSYPLLRGEDLDRFRLRYAGYTIVRSGDAKIFKPERLYEAPKLIIRRVANQLIAAIDRQGYHVLNTIYVARPRQANVLSLEYICALLNSRVANDYFHAVFVNDDRLFPYIRKEQLDQLPIALPDAQQEARIVSLVRQVSDDSGEHSGQIQAEIDRMIQQIFETQRSVSN